MTVTTYKLVTMSGFAAYCATIVAMLLVLRFEPHVAKNKENKLDVQKAIGLIALAGISAFVVVFLLLSRHHHVV